MTELSASISAPSARAMSVRRDSTKFLAVASPSAFSLAIASGRRAAHFGRVGHDFRFRLVGEEAVQDLDQDLHLVVVDLRVGAEQERAAEGDDAHHGAIHGVVRVAARETDHLVHGILERRVLQQWAVRVEAVAAGLRRPREQLERLEANRKQGVRGERLRHQLGVPLDLVHLADERLDVEVQVLLAQAERRLQQRGGRRPELARGEQTGPVRADLRLLPPAEEQALAEGRQHGDGRGCPCSSRPGRPGGCCRRGYVRVRGRG